MVQSQIKINQSTCSYTRDLKTFFKIKSFLNYKNVSKNIVAGIILSITNHSLDFNNIGKTQKVNLSKLTLYSISNIHNYFTILLPYLSF